MEAYPFPDAAWCTLDDVTIVLDCASDRYFRLEGDERTSRWHGRGQPRGLARPGTWRPAEQGSPALRSTGFSLAETARALWLQRRAETRLERDGLLSVLTALRRTLDAPRRRSSGASRKVHAVLQGFEHARLLRASTDRCLPRSVALATALASRGLRAQLVIGVMVAPFAAHCWVQDGARVLGDELADVQRYHPLLVL